MGEMGRWGRNQLPITNYQCPMPHAQFLANYALTLLAIREGRKPG